MRTRDAFGALGHRLRAAAPRGLTTRVRRWRYRGDTFECPCCDGRFRAFLPFGYPPRPNARCPGCGSLERHRLLWLYLKEKTGLLRDRLTVLHVAPEQWLQRLLRRLPNLDYLSIDLSSTSAMERMDITEIQKPSASFDVILCNHVLEHVPDDRRAMRELLRVLRPGGSAILQSPIDRTRATTLEDSRVPEPAERLRLFGQEDHVRLYGRDYRARLEAAGFHVREENYAGHLSPDLVARYQLQRDEEIYYCTRLTLD
jgi:SAM-dependent methyltransferase